MKLIRLIAAGALLAAGLPMAAMAQVNVNVQVTGRQLQSERTGQCELRFSRQPLDSTNYTATGSSR
jgi:hypothetical protein